MDYCGNSAEIGETNIVDCLVNFIMARVKIVENFANRLLCHSLNLLRGTLINLKLAVVCIRFFFRAKHPVYDPMHSCLRSLVGMLHSTELQVTLLYVSYIFFESH